MKTDSPCGFRNPRLGESERTLEAINTPPAPATPFIVETRIMRLRGKGLYVVGVEDPNF